MNFDFDIQDSIRKMGQLPKISTLLLPVTESDRKWFCHNKEPHSPVWQMANSLSVPAKSHATALLTKIQVNICLNFICYTKIKLIHYLDQNERRESLEVKPTFHVHLWFTEIWYFEISIKAFQTIWILSLPTHFNWSLYFPIIIVCLFICRSTN